MWGKAKVISPRSHEVHEEGQFNIFYFYFVASWLRGFVVKYSFFGIGTAHSDDVGIYQQP
jgi:hypothetical protein